ncbi:uncharacterized protein B0H18DRAFT_960040 [Fomitopsis serialis]|uniref:uncharacterized protein n=1 Tax=Fomitopsis serialis TaxID=139415 RepID=UPI0020080759|nr:uncharacterized protein B0H18DRAFT_960040 [Neoantrodia serialis]KAH9914035.1 hypothetical protein B0H18DRAFT_960040 [Neoantrodia serialis]
MPSHNTSYKHRRQDLLSRSNKEHKGDLLVHLGHHFGRTEHAFCNIKVILDFGLQCLEDAGLSESNEKQHRLFDTLRELDPNLEERLRDGEHTSDIAALIDAGRDGARSTDAQSVKKAILDWVHPDGGALIPPLLRDSRVGYGFAHVDTGRLLCPTHLDWDDAKIRKKLQNRTAVVTADQCPTFLYEDLTYDDDLLGRGP